MPKKKKPKKYFTKVHENAILEYVSSTDSRRRNILYVKIIQPAFLEMISKIVYRYKFTTLPNIGTLLQECEGHLITVLSKFDLARGSKAFSYFSVITKNWFIHKAKKFAQQSKKETQCEEISKSIEIRYLSTENEYLNNKIQEEFLKQLWVELNAWEKLNLKTNEKKILHAIKILLEQPNAIEIFNKKAIYLYLREITGLNTKQVLNNLTKFREFYKTFKTNWLSDIQ